jgi:predicted HD phosphohydrolase
MKAVPIIQYKMSFSFSTCSKHLLESVLNLYKTRGGNAYTIGESLTQYQHAVQSWRWMKTKQPQNPYLCSAAFLHDIGHLLEKEPIDPFVAMKDERHEERGGNFLQHLGFCTNVYQPVRLHVVAKRYLITSQPREYFSKLSDASKFTFILQGGLLDKQSMSQFENNFYFHSAILLRQCDDEAKSTSSADLSSIEMKQLEQDFQNALFHY